jgi:hypothetical protein
MEGWIDITEFASKYGVSASTLRRRIRSHTIPYKMEKGKYLIQDTSDALKEAPLFSRQNKGGQPRQSVRSNIEGDVHDPVANFMRDSTDTAVVQMRGEIDTLTNENRRLKAQIAELETLVRALEAELDEKA